MTAGKDENSANSSGNASGTGTKIGSGQWELTLYDQQRTPHETITDTTEIAVSPRSLNAELMCPICLDMLKNTMTAKECLHRFCNECITTALRSTNRECPTCRKKLVSKRSLRPDPNFDALIAKIYPNREEYDRMQEKALERYSKHNNTAALQQSIEEGMREQAILRRKHRVPGSYEYVKRERNVHRAAAEPQAEGSSQETTSLASEGGSFSSPKRTRISRESSIEPSASEASFSNANGGVEREVELILQPLSQNLSAGSSIPQNRYLKTSAVATIEHLAKYLEIRANLDVQEHRTNADILPDIKSGTGNPNSNSNYEIFVAVGNQHQILSPELTLDAVLNEYWKTKKPLKLFYNSITIENEAKNNASENSK